MEICEVTEPFLKFLHLYFPAQQNPNHIKVFPNTMLKNVKEKNNKKKQTKKQAKPDCSINKNAVGAAICFQVQA